MIEGDEDSFLDPVALARAEAALHNLAAEYPHRLEVDLTRADACLAAPADIDRLYTILHDIKGQAGTFGYPLVGAIAQRLCLGIKEGRTDQAWLELGVTLIRNAAASPNHDAPHALLTRLD
ncbi:MAG: Hpt domain-containing protein [Magnetospirillum gryphiswaldense]|nr:Hpt domain-containing protein [Magnetospirillum gryphiswaldense]